MKVKLFAYLRDYAGVREVEVSRCETVRQLLGELCGRFGARFEKELFDKEHLSGRVIVLVNGRNILDLKGLDTELKEDDEVSLFPVVAGGR